jgi:hypothetical protein
MIPDKARAAELARTITDLSLSNEINFEGWGGIAADYSTQNLFNEVLHYRFSGEALYIHLNGRMIEPSDVTWQQLPDEVKLCFTLYATLVPILNSWITPPPPVIEEPKPALPGRGFESINEDSSNRGTIYEREDWSKPQAGQAPAETQAPAEAGTDSASPSPTHTGSDVAGELSGASVADVTENTDPEPLVTYQGQGEGGEVVDDDDDETEGAEGGSVEADENTPAVTDQQPKRRKR